MIAAALALALAASAVDCTAPAGWSEIEASAPRYILFGELHGTEQAPAMFGDLACALASKGERILVAVELGAEENAGMQRAWAGPHAGFTAALLAAMPQWGKRNDGVTSQAMLAMLVRLHSLKTEGRKIDVVAFNAARDTAQQERWKALPGQGPHEAAQAENIRTAAEAGTYAHVLVLTGGTHAKKRPVTYDVTFEPMAMRLAPPAEIWSLGQSDSGGTSWSCGLKPGVTAGIPLDSSMIECGSHAQKGDGTGSPRISLSSNDPAYDGIFHVGAITASPPAVQKAKP